MSNKSRTKSLLNKMVRLRLYGSPSTILIDVQIILTTTTGAFTG
jgi:hypothetical protein